MRFLKRTVRSVFSRFGYSIVRNTVSGAGWKEVLDTAIPADKQPMVVLDIGANKGSFAKLVLSARADARVHAFEPIPELATELRLLANRYANLSCHETALGDADGHFPFRVHDNIDSSSLLHPDPEYQSRYPAHCRVAKVIDVPVTRLDAWAEKHLPPNLPIQLLKLDVQGYEAHVIRGGRKTFARTRFMVTEAALYPAYSGGVMVDELCSELRDIGFQLIWSFNVFAASVDLFWKNRQL